MMSITKWLVNLEDQLLIQNTISILSSTQGWFFISFLTSSKHLTLQSTNFSSEESSITSSKDSNSHLITSSISITTMNFSKKKLRSMGLLNKGLFIWLRNSVHLMKKRKISLCNFSILELIQLLSSIKFWAFSLEVSKQICFWVICFTFCEINLKRFWFETILFDQ